MKQGIHFELFLVAALYSQKRMQKMGQQIPSVVEEDVSIDSSGCVCREMN